MILAGGAGTRLWPLSRKARPKQLLRLLDRASLLQAAQRRVAPLFEPANTWVVTAADYVEAIARELPEVPRANLIGEPLPRDTSNAIGLAAELLARRDPQATMAVFTADHFIAPQAAFEAAIRTGLDAAEQHADALVTFGIPPERPECGYGYLRRGERVSASGPGAGVFRVAAFREKPTQAVAEAYVRSGEYLWNSGMFAWRLSAIRAALRRFVPDAAAALERTAAVWDDDSAAAAAERQRLFSGLTKVSIDYAVLERAADVLLVEMGCRWIDLGSWTAIAETRAADAAGNVVIAPRGMVVDGRDNVVVAEDEHLIVLLGVDDLVVVRSPDATLVCRRDQVQRVRELGALRQARYGGEFE